MIRLWLLTYVAVVPVIVGEAWVMAAIEHVPVSWPVAVVSALFTAVPAAAGLVRIWRPR